MSLLDMFRSAPKPVATNATAPGKKATRLAVGSSLLALAVATVGGYEGMRTKAYIPIPGDVPTVCFGETRGVKMGDQYTAEECRAMLGRGLAEFETGMRMALVAPDLIPDKRYVALLSLSYNIGLGAFGKSTLVRKLNAGDIQGACDAFMSWNKASGRVVPGLTRRRAEERLMCLEGLK